MFSKIIVGFDGSVSSKNALLMACDLAGKYGSELHIVHSVQTQTMAFSMGAVGGFDAVTLVPDRGALDEAANSLLAEASDIARASGQPDAKTHIGHSDPAEDLLTCAMSEGADLIVTGRRGLGNVSSLLLGSTSRKVSHESKCAHLTVA